ncbi:MAG: hypothetical protein NZ750_01985 [Anaerolineae bacterium]|nr:hypothetical protein [Anaerolineae bacterium]MDW8173551.1 hypothetical protein [Anaerolineae bacterium]
MLHNIGSGIARVIFAFFKLIVTVSMWGANGIFALMLAMYGPESFVLGQTSGEAEALVAAFGALMLSVVATLSLWSPMALPWISTERLLLAQANEGHSIWHGIFKGIATLIVWGTIGFIALAMAVQGIPLLGIAAMGICILATIALWAPASLPWTSAERLAAVEGYEPPADAKRKRTESAKRKRSPADAELEAALAMLDDDERMTLAREVRRRILENSLADDGEAGGTSLGELLRNQRRK